MAPPLQNSKVSARGPNIRIPLFTPSYTFSMNGFLGNRLFATRSLDPLFSCNALSNGKAGWIYADNYAVGPFGWGRTLINPGNYASGGGTAKALRYGNLLYLETGSVWSGTPATPTVSCSPIATAAAGALFNIGVNSILTAMPLGSSAAGYNFPFHAQWLAGQPPAFFQAIIPENGPLNGDAVFNVFPALGFRALASQTGNEWPGAATTQGEVISAVPIINTNKTSLLFLDNSNNIYVGIWDFFHGGIADNGILPITFDNAALNAIGFTVFQSTQFGHLARSNSTFEGQGAMVLINLSGYGYNVIKIEPQSKEAAANYPYTNLNTQSATIDRQGIFYMVDSTSTSAATRVLNSYALNIFWAPVVLPTLNQPNISIPGLCGCQPPSFGPMTLPAPTT